MAERLREAIKKIFLRNRSLFKNRLNWYPEPESNRHERNARGILSPLCLPIPPPGQLIIKIKSVQIISNPLILLLHRGKTYWYRHYLRRDSITNTLFCLEFLAKIYANHNNEIMTKKIGGEILDFYYYQKINPKRTLSLFGFTG